MSEEKEWISADYLEEQSTQLSKLFHIIDELQEFNPLCNFAIIMNKDSGKISCCINDPHIDFRFGRIAEFFGRPLDLLERKAKWDCAIREFNNMALELNPNWDYELYKKGKLDEID